MRAWVAEAKKEAGPDEFLRNSSDSASCFLCSFSLGHLDGSWWDENKVSRNNWNYFEKMAFGLGIKSRFWLFGLGGELISGRNSNQKLGIKPISGKNSDQKFDEYPKTGIKSNFWE